MNVSHADPTQAAGVPAAGNNVVAVVDAQASTTPVPQPSERRAREYAGLNERVKKQAAAQKVHLAFLGDSITEGWSDRGIETWKKYFEPLNAINLGIGGDETQHILWRIDHGSFEGYSPEAIILLAGTNNLGNSHMTSEQTARGIRAVVRRLTNKFPKARILVVGVFPRGAAASDPYRQQVNEINNDVKNLADDKQVFFMDIGPEFVSSDGSISPEVMPDALHLTPKSYEVYGRLIASKVKELTSAGENSK